MCTPVSHRAAGREQIRTRTEQGGGSYGTIFGSSFSFAVRKEVMHPLPGRRCRISTAVCFIRSARWIDGFPLQKRCRGYGSALMPKSKTARDRDQPALITGILYMKR